MHTQNRKVFMLNNERPCGSKEELLCAYADAAAAVTLSGPTSFAPAIGEAVDMCRSTGKYFVLILIADGLMVSCKHRRYSTFVRRTSRLRCMLLLRRAPRVRPVALR